mgnify:CR=1 FL=1
MRTPLQDNQEISVAERALTLWGDTVYRVALGQTGSRAEAEDIYQDVFLKLLDQPRAFDSDDHLAAAPKRAPQPLVRREPSVHCGVLVARPDTLWLLPAPLFSS